MKPLRILPTLDSPTLAAARQRELDIPRARATALGSSAVAFAQSGRYVTEDGQQVEWGHLVQAAVSAKRTLPPDAPLPTPPPAQFPTTRVQVSNETTLGASRRLVEQGLRPLALNFANGIQPGGGFLHGSRAQEEVLCRSSALYLTLLGDPMYEAHRQRPRADSTDWAILSPAVPVFRQDDGTALDQPWLLDIITCAAPVATNIGQPESGNLLEQRIQRVLEIARAYQYTCLVLGAWGCGAFRNDPVRTPTDFRTALEGEFVGAFSDIVFAIADWSPERKFLGPFRDVFAAPVTGTR